MSLRPLDLYELLFIRQNPTRFAWLKQIYHTHQKHVFIILQIIDLIGYLVESVNLKIQSCFYVSITCLKNVNILPLHLKKDPRQTLKY